MSSKSIYPEKQSPELYSGLPHTMEDRTPYTYLIGWSDHDKWYYGRKTAAGCHPSTFWKDYFTSSKYVKRFRKEHGEPDVIQIDHVFESVKECCEYEEKYLIENNAVISKLWLNESNCGKSFNTNGKGIAKDSITGEKLGCISSDDPRWESGSIVGILYGSKLNNEQKKNMIGKNIGNKPWNKGLTKETNETLKLIGEKYKEWYLIEENKNAHIERVRTIAKRWKENGTFAGENNPMYGRNQSEDTKEKIRQKALGRPAPNKGKKMSEEQKEKLRKPKSDAHKENMRKAWARRKSNMGQTG